ncbi:Transcriptional regulatory protein ZraR [subsurface metagenome]
MVSHFLRKYNRVDDKNAKGISSQALKLLMDYDWPGNVRELENVIERTVVLGQGDMFLPSDLSRKVEEKPLKSGVTSSSVDISLAEAEKRLIEDTLKLTHWNQTKAAKSLGIHRNTLRRKIKYFKICRE